MSARTTPLDERYGRTPTRRRRGLVGAATAGAVVLAGVVAWSVWTGVGGAADALDPQTITSEVRSAEATEVRWLVTGKPGTRLVCVIEARDGSGVVVGLVEAVLPATGDANRRGDTVVRTVRRASTGLIVSCRDA
ncbi:DUF4307 domain-containing protein [uncultured Amnibacterium sp.]|uniref:DUF4307 domain-containing protein n=1 Tax=uncultured Amnibacterium sp. TaxID=1631851 RepID=UPI0035CA27B0